MFRLLEFVLWLSEFPNGSSVIVNDQLCLGLLAGIIREEVPLGTPKSERGADFVFVANTPSINVDLLNLIFFVFTMNVNGITIQRNMIWIIFILFH